MSKTIKKEEVVKKSNQPQSVDEIKNFKFKLDWKDWSSVVNLITIYEELLFQSTMDIKQMYSILFDREVMVGGSSELSEEDMKSSIEQQRIQLLELRRNLFNQHPIFNKGVKNI